MCNPIKSNENADRTNGEIKETITEISSNVIKENLIKDLSEQKGPLVKKSEENAEKKMNFDDVD